MKKVIMCLFCSFFMMMQGCGTVSRAVANATYPGGIDFEVNESQDKKR